jgi:hypothetical protein
VGKSAIGQAFALLAAGSTSLTLVAGNVTIGQLSIVAPLLRGRSFAVAVTALQTESPTGTSPVVMTDPRSMPVTVRIYAPSGIVPSPRATVGGAGVTAAFRSSGTVPENALTVTAVAGTASTSAQIFAKNDPPRACAPLRETGTFEIPEKSGLASGFFIRAAIAGSTPVKVELDTGSTTFLLSKNKLKNVDAKQLIGPGQAASETLEPSGVTVSGNYYLAPVTLSTKRDGKLTTLGTTVPMEVLLVDKSCSKSGVCTAGNTSYMGVGFGRPPDKPGQFLLKTPLENAFLQLTGIVTGSMHPGFVLTPTSLTIGINRASATGFSLTPLQAFAGRPGDWNGPPACLRFDGGAYQCGSMLLDIGIRSMFVAAPTPSPLHEIEIVAPSAVKPYLEYAFHYPVRAGATPPAPNPNASPPIAFPKPGATPYVNTGRYALAAASYLYDAGCGRVGFKKP